MQVQRASFYSTNADLDRQAYYIRTRLSVYISLNTFECMCALVCLKCHNQQYESLFIIIITTELYAFINIPPVTSNFLINIQNWKSIGSLSSICMCLILSSWEKWSLWFYMCLLKDNAFTELMMQNGNLPVTVSWLVWMDGSAVSEVALQMIVPASS